MRRVKSVLDVLVPSLRLIISGYLLPAEYSAVWAYIPKLIKRIKVLVADKRLQRNNTNIAQQTRTLGTSVTEF